MFLYFNKNGQLLERLEHGPQARAGSTNFEIFAYFEGLDLERLYTTSTISFIKPDFDRTILGNLKIDSYEARYEVEDGENPIHFVNGKSYKGLRFDFASYEDGQDNEVLLDTVGQWAAIIKLKGSDGRQFVQGQANFTVASGTESEDGNTLGLSTIIDGIFTAIASKLNVNSAAYFRVVDEIPEHFESYAFNVGDVLYNKSDKGFYRLVSLDEAELIDISINGISVSDETSIELRNGKLLSTEEYVNREVIASFSYDPDTSKLRFFNKEGTQIGQDLTVVSDVGNLSEVAFTGKFDDLVDKPTTLAGYGITNAYTKTETNNLRVVSEAEPTEKMLGGAWIQPTDNIILESNGEFPSSNSINFASFNKKPVSNEFPNSDDLKFGEY